MFAIVFGGLLSATFVLLAPAYLTFVGYAGRSDSLTLMFGGLILLQGASLVPSSVLTDPHKLRFQSKASALTGVAKVVVAGSLIPMYGATGSILASVIAVAFIQLPMYLFATWRTPA